MLCSKIFLTISGKLQDLREPRRWQWENTNPAAPSFLDYLNTAITQIVSMRPDASAVTGDIQLVEGFKQQIPATASSLINILYNSTALGVVGRQIRQTKFKSIIGLPVASGSAVDCYAYDKMDNPTVFWVYPHVPIGGLYVNATVSQKPMVVLTKDDEFPLSSQFVSPAIHWMLYDIYSGDNTDTDLVRAQHHYDAFMQELGMAIEVDSKYPIKPKAGNIQ